VTRHWLHRCTRRLRGNPGNFLHHTVTLFLKLYVPECILSLDSDERAEQRLKSRDALEVGLIHSLCSTLHYSAVDINKRQRPKLPKTRKTRIATVTPVYRKALTPDEQISLHHLQHFLSQYENIAIVPDGLCVTLPGFHIKRFPSRCFESVATYNRLLLTPTFYQAFSDYDYILIYQPDCLVFSTDLKYWCDTGYDYIGAPWFTGYADRHSPQSPLWAVGNGGFSLRKVSSFLKVFDSEKKWIHPEGWWRYGYALKSWRSRVANRLKYILKKMAYTDDVFGYLKIVISNEDAFWGMDASHFEPDFRVAPLDVALSFAFEKDPRHCFESNGRRLPFGCHAWAKWDKAFWQPYLISSPKVRLRDR
jgi:hypothetical protein